MRALWGGRVEPGRRAGVTAEEREAGARSEDGFYSGWFPRPPELHIHVLCEMPLLSP